MPSNGNSMIFSYDTNSLDYLLLIVAIHRKINALNAQTAKEAEEAHALLEEKLRQRGKGLGNTVDS